MLVVASLQNLRRENAMKKNAPGFILEKDQKIIIDELSNDKIEALTIQESRLAVGVLPTDILRVDIQSNVDLSGCGFGAVFVAGDNGFFEPKTDYPNNPYRISSYYDSGDWDYPILGFSPVRLMKKHQK